MIRLRWLSTTASNLSRTDWSIDIVLSSYTIDIILTKENMAVKGNRVAPLSSLTGLLVLLTCIQQRAACKQCVTLALGNFTVGLEGLGRRK